MNANSSNEEVIIIKPERLNRIGLIFLPFVILSFGLPFYLCKGWNNIIIEWNFFSHWFLPIIVFGVLIHESIHGIICGLFAPSKFKAVKFGFSLSMLSPYTHCKQALKGWQYALSLILPGIILGIIPSVIAIFSSKIGFLFGGLIFTWGAIADFTILWYIRNQLHHTQILDHPTMTGCIVLH